LGGALKVDEISHYNLVSELLFELIPILLVSGESVKQIPSVPISLDTLFEQLDH
jgi:hypothetical protein